MAGFRRFKRRYLPFLLEGYEVRRLRDRLLRKVGLTRAYEPEALTLNPTLRFDGLLSLVAAAHVLEHGEIRFLQVGAFDAACSSSRSRASLSGSATGTNAAAT
jgi:hypothetical protein